MIRFCLSLINSVLINLAKRSNFSFDKFLNKATFFNWSIFLLRSINSFKEHLYFFSISDVLAFATKHNDEQYIDAFNSVLSSLNISLSNNIVFLPHITLSSLLSNNSPSIGIIILLLFKSPGLNISVCLK